MTVVMAPATPAPAARRFRRWFAGAAVCLSAFLLILVGYLWMLLSSLTEPEPRVVPLEPLPRHEADALEDRVLAFQQALRQQSPTPPLALTTREMNGLIAFHPGLKAAKGRLRLDLNGEFPKAVVSARLSELHMPVFRGRYFNGTIGFSLSMHEGSLVMRAHEVRSRTRPVPGFFMEILRRYNLAAAVNEDARFALTLENVRDVQVKQGVLVITAKNSTQ